MSIITKPTIAKGRPNEIDISKSYLRYEGINLNTIKPSQIREILKNNNYIPEFSKIQE